MLLQMSGIYFDFNMGGGYDAPARGGRDAATLPNGLAFRGHDQRREPRGQADVIRRLPSASRPNESLRQRWRIQRGHLFEIPTLSPIPRPRSAWTPTTCCPAAEYSSRT